MREILQQYSIQKLLQLVPLRHSWSTA